MARTPLEPWKYVRDRGSELMSWSDRQVRRHNRDILSIFYDIKVYCMFSLESPHWGDSNEYTQYTIFNTKNKKILHYGIIPMDSRMSLK